MMSHARALPSLTSISEFDSFLDTQREDSRWELLDGRIVAMTTPSLAHAEIVANVRNTLVRALPLDKNCRVTSGDVRLQASDDRNDLTAVVPDVMVWCGPIHDRRYHVTTPQVIVEVLSPSTMDHDRGGKLHFYKTELQTLRQIVLVYHDEMRVECYDRTDLGWSQQTLARASDTLRFPAVGCAMSLAAVYDGLSLAG